MKTARRILVLLLVLLAAMTAFAKEKYTFYVFGADPGADPAFIAYYAGVKHAMKLLPDVKIIYVGLAGEDISATGIANKLEQAIAARPDGIITGFWFLQAEDEPVRNAIKQGIKVIAYNQPDPRPEGQRIPYLGYVGVEARDIGIAMANESLKRVNIKRAAIAIHHVGSASVETVAAGVASVLEAKKVPFDKLEITVTPSTAINVLNSYVNRYPATNFIFTLGAAGAIPTLRFIQEQGLQGKVFAAAYEVTKEVSKGIKDGIIPVAIEHQSFTQTFYPIIELYNYLEYGLFPLENLYTGPIVVDKSNVDTYQKQLDTIWK
jgi:simple sugar transport system substrate-binding protein